MNFDAEVDFVTSVLQHPAGYDLDLFGMLWVRPTDQGTYEVEWENDVEGKIVTLHESFDDPRAAADCFVRKRVEFRLGIDFEIEDMAHLAK